MKQTYKRNENNSPYQNISAAEELLKWHDLLEKGIITPEEFEKKEKRINISLIIFHYNIL